MKALQPTSSRSVICTLYGNVLQIKLGKVLYSVRLVNADFPDYEKVFPRELNHEVIIDRESLKQSLLRAGAIFSEKIKKVLFCFKENQLLIKATNSEHDKLVDSVTIENQKAADLNIGFNASYLLDFIGNIEAQNLKISFVGRDAGVLLTPADEMDFDYSYVVMPLKI